MRKAVTILLTLLLSLLVVGIGAAVPSPDILEEALERHTDAYRPKEYDFIDNLGADDGTPSDAPEDEGIDFGAFGIEVISDEVLFG